MAMTGRIVYMLRNAKPSITWAQKLVAYRKTLSGNTSSEDVSSDPASIALSDSCVEVMTNY